MHLRTQSGVFRRATAAGALVVVALLAAPAFACTPSPNLTANPMTAEAGATVTVTGNNYDPTGTPVTVALVDNSDKASEVGSQLPDEKGSFTLAVTLPKDLRPGDYILIGRQVRGDAEPMVGRVQNTFRVLAPGEAPPAPARNGTPSPGTGDQGTTTPANPAPSSSGSATNPAPTSSPAATEPAAASSPAASPAAQAPTRTAPADRSSAVAPAPVAPASVAVAPATDEQPAAPAAPAEERAADPSPRSTGADLWSGFNGQSADRVPTIDGPAVPAGAPADSLATGIALLVIGTLTLLAGVGLAAARRTRARVQA